MRVLHGGGPNSNFIFAPKYSIVIGLILNSRKIDILCCSVELHKSSALSVNVSTMSFMLTVEDPGTDERHSIKRENSSSTDSPNGNSNNDSSPCTSDTG